MSLRSIVGDSGAMSDLSKSAFWFGLAFLVYSTIDLRSIVGDSTP